MKASQDIGKEPSLFAFLAKWIALICCFTCFGFVIFSLLTPPLLRGNACYFLEITNNFPAPVVLVTLGSSGKSPIFEQDTFEVPPGETIRVSSFAGGANGSPDTQYIFRANDKQGRILSEIVLMRPQIIRAVPRDHLPFIIDKTGKLIYDVQ